MPIDGVVSRPAFADGARAATLQPRPAARPGAGRPVERVVPVRAPLRGAQDGAGPAAAPWLAHRLVEGMRGGPIAPHASGVAAYPTLAASMELFAPGETIALPAGRSRPIVVRVA